MYVLPLQRCYSYAVLVLCSIRYFSLDVDELKIFFWWANQVLEETFWLNQFLVEESVVYEMPYWTIITVYIKYKISNLSIMTLCKMISIIKRIKVATLTWSKFSKINAEKLCPGQWKRLTYWRYVIRTQVSLVRLSPCILMFTK